MRNPSRFILAATALSLSLVPAPASADWPSCGRVISAPANQVQSSIAPDGAGGAIITWQDQRSSRVNIFAQHVLATGQLDATWPASGRALVTDSVAAAAAAGGQTAPAAVTDGRGGAIVVWQDLRSDVTETDIFAQHVLASGEVDPDWKANGAGLVALEGPQHTFAVVADGEGGAIVVWMDGRPGASDRDIYAQHVLASGIMDPRWPINGMAVSTAPGLQQFPAIIEDGVGGAIITWDDLRSGVTGDDIYAQHILNSGAQDRGWPVAGLEVCTALNAQGRPTITSDGANGAILAWTDSRVVGTSHIFAMHVLGSGALDPGWPVNGRFISDPALSESGAQAVSDGAGGAIVNWQGFGTQLNMYAQHVTATGIVDPAWPSGGRALSLTDRQQAHSRIVSDGFGGAIVAWDEEAAFVVAQHVLANGALDPGFPVNGRVLCNLPRTRGDPAMVASSGGGAIVSWTDSRNGSDTDIIALQVLLADPLGVPNPTQPGIVFARQRPNPTSGPMTLRFALPRTTHVRLSILDAAGRRVRELVSGSRPAGEQAVAWDLRDARGAPVLPGLYIARLEAEGRSLIQKVAAIK